MSAPRAIPAHTNAAVDGYAFSFEGYNAKDGAVFSLAGWAAAGDAMESAVPKGVPRGFSPGRSCLRLRHGCDAGRLPR